jgi:vancomycin permeability regulator SanA
MNYKIKAKDLKIKRKKSGNKKTALRIAIFFTVLVMVGAVCFSFHVIRLHIDKTANPYVMPDDVNLASSVKTDCILVLGAGIPKGKPGPSLTDRLLAALELYENGVSDKIIVSGGKAEVDVMTEYLIENGVPEDSIIGDDKGLSTVESAYRVKNAYGFSSVSVATQKFHVRRAVYDCLKVGLEVYGYNSETITDGGYVTRVGQNTREYIACFKDYYMVKGLSEQ